MSADPVIVVARRSRFGLFQPFYLPGILRAMWVAGGRLRRNLRKRGGESRSGDQTIRYPEERAKLPPAFRGMPVLIADAEGAPRCVACGGCATACPTRCIRVLGSREQGLRGFEIDMSRCIFCGACEESCEDQAIAMSRHVEVAAFDRGSLVFHLSDLLVPSEYVEARLQFLGATPEPPHDASGAAEGKGGR